MLRSMQAIAFSMKNQADRMNVIANNIANVNTRAYKKDVLNTKSFDEAMLQAIEYNSGNNTSNPIGVINFSVSPDEYRTNFLQGNIQETGFNNDFAIRGDGFFALETPNGIEYTRGGNFTFDEDGYLVTQDGNNKCYIMGENGRIQEPSKKIKVDSKGNIENGGRLRIVAFNNLRLLKKASGGNYINTDQQNIRESADASIMQGYLEDSNVSIVEETRDMLDTKRNYESCQQIIKMLDDTLGKAVSEIGKL